MSWSGLVWCSPRFFLGGVRVNSQVRSTSPMPLEPSWDAWRVYEVGWRMTRKQGASGSWRQISIRFCLGRGPGGAQTLNERALTCGGGRWGSAWWCHDMVLAWIKEQESSGRIRQEAFSSGSHTVVDTRFHLALPSRHPPRWEIQRVSEAVCSQIACWNLPAPSDDPAPRRQWLNSASLNANSVESCQWGQAKADLGSPDLLSGEGGLGKAPWQFYSPVPWVSWLTLQLRVWL